MTNETRCIAGRLLALSILLLCLCCSRGEGLHLLPFAEEPTPPVAFEPSGRSGIYQYSVDPQNASALKHSTKKNAADASDPTFLSATVAAAAGSAGLRFTATPKDHTLVRTKFELTASSDRSPPFSLL